MKRLTLLQIRFIVATASTLLGSTTLFLLYRDGITNIYGDGIAHLNIARRIVDLDTESLWLRYAQLGSPWLPLQHILMLPFVWHDYLWRSGLAGSLVSLASYVGAVVLFFEIGMLVGGELKQGTGSYSLSCGLASASAFGLNPSLLYLQTTPMTEPLFLLAVAATVYTLMRWIVVRSRTALIASGLVAALSTLTRYEAWGLLPAGALLLLALEQGNWRERFRSAVLWSALASLGPIYWFWHNWATYANPLEFLTGYYSARGIFARQSERLGWTDFVRGRPVAALLLAAMTAAACSGLLSTLAAFIGAVRALLLPLRRLPLACTSWLLLIPFLFTVYSLVTGNIQIYPFSAVALLNARYGVGLLPALAGMIALWRGRSLWLVLALILGQYGWMLKDGYRELAVIQEPLRNNVHTREARARSYLAAWLQSHPPDGKILMYGAESGSVILHGGLRFRDIIFFYDGGRLEGLQGVRTIVVAEGDALWLELQRVEEFKYFKRVYRVGPRPVLTVWQRL